MGPPIQNNKMKYYILGNQDPTVLMFSDNHYYLKSLKVPIVIETEQFENV